MVFLFMNRSYSPLNSASVVYPQVVPSITLSLSTPPANGAPTGCTATHLYAIFSLLFHRTEPDAFLKGQYVDGLRAPLVLHPPKEAAEYDEEFTIILGDWYHEEHAVLLKQFISIANPGGAEPVPSKSLVFFIDFFTK